MKNFSRTLISTYCILFLFIACGSTEKVQTIVPSIPYEHAAEKQKAVQPIKPASPIYNGPQDAVSKRIYGRLSFLMKDEFLKENQLGLYVYDLTANQPLFEHGGQQRMRPASTMKVITATTALSQLGPDYYYTTTLLTKGEKSGTQLKGDLYVYGGFDPLFDQKDMNGLVNALYQKGYKRIQGDIILDVSMKEDKKAGWGWCWDDRNPSLSPLLFNGKGTFANAMRQAMRRKGIQVTGSFKTGVAPCHVDTIAIYGRPITDVLKPMMKMSVNQAAESMFYQIGTQSDQKYPDRKIIVRYVKSFIENQLHLNPDNYQIADGSGLSQYNYVTPELLMATLRYAYNNKAIYSRLLESLPIAGVDGTLKNRMHGTTAYRNVCAKTGTLTGLSSLAGYATASNGHRLCFAIICQGQLRSASARNMQDEICKILTE